MNIYVIYRFDDYDNVKKQIDKADDIPNITFFYFKPGDNGRFWHRRAKKKIKESNMVVFFDSFADNTPNKFKHIKWELKCAEKYKKKVVVFKENVENIKLYSSKIYSTDYSENFPNRFKYKTVSYDKMVTFLEEQANWTVEGSLIKSLRKDGEPLTDGDKQILLEQYKIMIDTSEKLMERRQATANLYTTICSALIAFVGTSFGVGISLLSSVVSLLAGIIIIMLCANWRSSLRAYELNNGGKFEVINEIERHLPAEMFDCEYRYNTHNGIRSYSTRERTLPLVFMFFGGVLTIVAICMLFYCLTVPQIPQTV